MHRLAVLRENQGQRPPGDILLSLLAELLGNAPRYAQNVLLNVRRLREDVVIDPLKQVMHLCATHAVGDAVGVVDVPAPVRTPAHKVPVNLERRSDFLEFLLCCLAKLCHIRKSLY